MLPENTLLIREKVEDLISELKHHCLWKSDTPAWVGHYAESRSVSEVDFFEWLQFVYIPNKLHPDKRNVLPSVLVMPQARPFITQSKDYNSIVRLMVELDAL